MVKTMDAGKRYVFIIDGFFGIKRLRLEKDLGQGERKPDPENVVLVGLIYLRLFNLVFTQIQTFFAFESTMHRHAIIYYSLHLGLGGGWEIKGIIPPYQCQ